MARPEGTPNITEDQISKIVEMTRDGEDRPKIAEEVGVSKTTVYNYQKKFDLL